MITKPIKIIGEFHGIPTLRSLLLVSDQSKGGCTPSTATPAHLRLCAMNGRFFWRKHGNGNRKVVKNANSCWPSSKNGRDINCVTPPCFKGNCSPKCSFEPILQGTSPIPKSSHSVLSSITVKRSQAKISALSRSEPETPLCRSKDVHIEEKWKVIWSAVDLPNLEVWLCSSVRCVRPQTTLSLSEDTLGRSNIK